MKRESNFWKMNLKAKIKDILLIFIIEYIMISKKDESKGKYRDNFIRRRFRISKNQKI